MEAHTVGSATPRRFFFLGAHLDERIEPAQEGLQCAKLRGGWRPDGGLLGLDEAREHLRIHRIGLLAQPQALGIGLGARRVDDTHRVPGLMQRAGQGFAVGAGGLQTRVHGLPGVGAKPLQAGADAGRIVGEDFGLELALREQGHIELEFGNIDSKRDHDEPVRK
jgi:hypothetical protein